jgi:hypothetical protein
MVAEDITRFTSAEDGDIVLEVLFNCEECTHDWRAEVDIPHNQNLYPKFWG